MAQRATPILYNFNGGELSPLLYGRTEHPKYKTGCRHLRNFIPLIQGPARRRSGTRWVAAVKDSAKRTWLRRFVFNVNQPYVLEFGHLYVRFYANRGVVESSPGVPLEVATPYTESDLISMFGTLMLDFAQTGDILYITHPSYAPRKLTRTGAAAFNLATMVPVGGPFKDVDPLQTTTVYASADTGTVTLTASAAIFTAANVGQLFYLASANNQTLLRWVSGREYDDGDQIRIGGLAYLDVTGSTRKAGTIQPIHTKGTQNDGAPNIAWQFHDPGYGWARITAIGGGGTTATATVIEPIPYEAVGSGNASTNWAQPAWSDLEGWPSHVTFFRERLVFARVQSMWMSVTADFENFTRKDRGGNVVADQSIVVSVASDQANKIQWMAPSDVALLVGTSGDEFAVAEITTSQALGPNNIRANPQTSYGSRQVPVTKIGNGVLFVQKSGRKVRDVQYNLYYQRYDAPDTTKAAEHLTLTGLVDLAYQQEPDSLLWAVRADGGLICLTLDREEEVAGWHPHPLGGFSDLAQTEPPNVEAVCTIPNPSLNGDDLWMIVQRSINGVSLRYVEYLETPFITGDDPMDAAYLDSGLTLNGRTGGTLVPTSNADEVGNTAAAFYSYTAFPFVAGDIGKQLQARYYTMAVDGTKTWHTAKALITGVGLGGAEASGTILEPFPDGVTYPEGTWGVAETVISGIIHLPGQVVGVYANGAQQTDRVVDGSGQITLDADKPAFKVRVGLRYTSLLQPMYLEVPTNTGTSQAQIKRIDELKLRMLNALGIRFGHDENGHLDEIPFRADVDAMNEPVPLFSGDMIELAWPYGHEREGLLTLIADGPFPATICALMPNLTNESQS